jgi:hypothetical protein
MTSKQALKWVQKQGIVLQSARGPAPSFAEWVVGEKIRGSWWAHPRANEIFRLAESVCDSGDVLICKLVNGKVTYVHRRIWPSLIRLSTYFSKDQLAQVESVHTPSGKHELKVTPYPRWAPAKSRKEAKLLDESDAVRIVGEKLLKEISTWTGR